MEYKATIAAWFSSFFENFGFACRMSYDERTFTAERSIDRFVLTTDEPAFCGTDIWIRRRDASSPRLAGVFGF
jgi:hypothetical protein